MRKHRYVIIAAAMAALLATLPLPAASAEEPVTLRVNGRVIECDAPPFILNGRTMAPVRALSEALGAAVGWEEGTRTVTVLDASSERISLLESALAPRSAVEAAMTWARAVKTRNGALQRAVEAPSLREPVPSSWVTGLSSPWIEDCQVEFSPETGSTSFDVRFHWWTSAGSAGSTVTRLEVGRFPDLPGSPWLVTKAQPRAQSGSEPASLSPAGIPFLFVEKTETGAAIGSYPVRLAALDWERGGISLADLPAFAIRDPKRSGYGFSWDGGDSLRVVQHSIGDLWLEEDLTRKGTSGLKAQMVTAPRGALVAGETAGEGILRISCDSSQGTAEFDIERGGNVEKSSVRADFAADVSLVRPVAADWRGDAIHAYFETARPSPGGTAFGLAAAILQGREVTWRTICADLGISEAGAGTRMAKAGEAIYVAKQDGTVSRVDIASGEVLCCDEIDRALTSFGRRHASTTEHPVTPELFSYQGALVVIWEPAAIEARLSGSRLRDERFPASCVLVARDGRIACEVVTVKDWTYVIRGGVVKQAILRSNGNAAPEWVFPASG